MFENATFSELVKMADRSPKLRPHIRDTYMLAKFRVHKKELRVHQWRTAGQVTGQSVNVADYDTAHMFLTHFGDLVRRLRFSNEFGTFTADQVQLLGQDIAMFCGKSLRRIELQSVGYYLLRDTRLQFTAVTSVSVAYREFERKPAELYRIYPLMDELTLRVVSSTNIRSILSAYQHLKTVAVEARGERVQNADLTHFMRLNPQLVSLSLNAFPALEVLQFIGDTAAHLSTLALKCNDFDAILDERTEQPAYLKTVKNLKIRDPYSCPSPLPLTFDRLERIELDIFGVVGDHVIRELIEKNNYTRALSIPATELYPSDFAKIREFMRMLPALEELEVMWSERVPLKHVVALMGAQEHAALKKLVLRLPVALSSRMIVAEMVPDEWEVTGVEQSRFYHVYTVVRKGAAGWLPWN